MGMKPYASKRTIIRSFIFRGVACNGEHMIMVVISAHVGDLQFRFKNGCFFRAILPVLNSSKSERRNTMRTI